MRQHQSIGSSATSPIAVVSASGWFQEVAIVHPTPSFRRKPKSIAPWVCISRHSKLDCRRNGSRLSPGFRRDDEPVGMASLTDTRPYSLITVALVPAPSAGAPSPRSVRRRLDRAGAIRRRRFPGARPRRTAPPPARSISASTCAQPPAPISEILVGHGDRRHDGQALVADLAEALAQLLDRMRSAARRAPSDALPGRRRRPCDRPCR